MVETAEKTFAAVYLGQCWQLVTDKHVEQGNKY